MTGPDGTARPTRRPVRRFRSDRVYLGWQFALLYPDPGPPPRRPTPAEQDQLNPAWVAAQRREENQLNRPLKFVVAATLGLGGLVLVFTLVGPVNTLLAAILIVACLFVAGAAGYALRQSQRVLKQRIEAERHRLERFRTEQERKLFAAQEDHARRYQAWQDRKVAYDRQLQWYAVAVPDEIDRLDVAGGTVAGWSALLTTIGTGRISAGGELSILDLSDGSVAADLVRLAGNAERQPQVWVLPEDLPTFGLGAELGRAALADVLSLVVGVREEQDSFGARAFDRSILERILGVLDGPVSIGRVTAALRALAWAPQAPRTPQDDLRRGLLSADERGRVGELFGNRGADRVLERVRALERQLRSLEPLGSLRAELLRAQLRVVSVTHDGAVRGEEMLGTYAATALAHALKAAPAGKPWQHTVAVCDADRLRGDVLDRLAGACEASRTGLVLCYGRIPQHVRDRLGRGNAVVAFMRLGNVEDAKAASEQIGTGHRFALSRLTEKVGTRVAETANESCPSTAGSGADWPSTSYAAGDETFPGGVTRSTWWGSRTAQANESLARSAQRYRELTVDQHELQRLPVTAVIVTYGSRHGRRVVLADANPAIFSLPRSTVEELDDARPLAEDRPVAHASDPGGLWGGGLPPNLGPPPDRLDWR